MKRSCYILSLLLAFGTGARAQPVPGPISTPPAGSPAPAAPAWLPRYNLDIQLDVDGHTAKVVQKVVVVNHFAKPLDKLVFNVHSAVLPPSGTVDYIFLAKMLEIMRVPASQGIYHHRACVLEKAFVSTGAEDRVGVSFAYRSDNECALEVSLPRAVAPGESVLVELQYSFLFPQKQGRWGQWKGVTFLSNWCPVLAFYDDEKGWQPTPFVAWHQPWFNEAGVFEAKVNLPSDQIVGSSGPVREIRQIGDRKEIAIGPVTSRDFAFLCSNRFQEVAVVSNGVRVKVLAFPEHEHYAKAIAGISSRAIDQYAKWFGPFNSPELTIVESYFGWNGNECGNLIMIDERVFDMPKLAEGYVEYLVSHETCHQWWYNAIGTDGYRETFMDEAFATFFAHKLLDGARGRNNAMLKYPEELSWLPKIERENYRFSSFYSTLNRGDLKPPLTEMENYRHIGNLFSSAYDRGSKIVGLIEDRLGEAAFLEFSARIYRKYYFRVCLAKDYQRELEEFTGQSWDDFFKRWLYGIGMTDWSLQSVKIEDVPAAQAKVVAAMQKPPADPIAPAPATGTGTVPPPEAAPPKPMAYQATVILRQKAEYNEPTQLGVSFDGTTYPIRIAVGIVPQRTELANPPTILEPLPDNTVKVTFLLEREPKQIAVDPDRVLPDANPGNNTWKSDPRIRFTPLYTFLDETPLTTDYHRWNITVGPWLYGPNYADPWFTRSDMFGVRAGAYRTETFNGGVYSAYRTDHRDIVAGVDGVFQHFPDGKSEVGFVAEKSLYTVNNGDKDIDRFLLYGRYNITQTSSMYQAPMHYAEIFGSWQRNDLPEPRETLPGLTRLRDQTNFGIHYHLDYLTPYWDPEVGAKLDLTYAVGVPILGEQPTTQQVSGQLSGVFMPPEWTGWFGQTKIAWRLWGGFGGPDKYALFSLGGGQMFRGFDINERQGNAGWIGSLEWRVPVIQESHVSVCDQVVGLRNLYLAPFYDVGDMYATGHSYTGSPAQALGVGLRMDVAWFSFIERSTIRIDVAKTVNAATPVQVWFGITHPF